MPPAPSFSTISYGPCRDPAARGMLASNFTLTRGAFANRHPSVSVRRESVAGPGGEGQAICLISANLRRSMDFRNLPLLHRLLSDNRTWAKLLHLCIR